MKIILGLVLVIIGYFIGSYFPVSGFTHSTENIIGTAQLKVTVLRPDKTPVTNLEVDIATTPGAPLSGGIMKTDSNGVATFKVKPATYYIFFNANNFPKNLEYHEDQSIDVQEGQQSNITINLFAKL